MYTEKDLFSNNDEQNRGNFDTDVGILELFGKEPLENLQSIISKVTGLGFVTADFRGTTYLHDRIYPFLQIYQRAWK